MNGAPRGWIADRCRARLVEMRERGGEPNARLCLRANLVEEVTGSDWCRKQVSALILVDRHIAAAAGDKNHKPTDGRHLRLYPVQDRHRCHHGLQSLLGLLPQSGRFPRLRTLQRIFYV